MQDRRVSDASLSSIEASGDADDSEKKKKKNEFTNLILKKRKSKRRSSDEPDDPIFTSEAEENNPGMPAEVIVRPRHDEPLLDRRSLSTSDSTKPKVPPRPRKHPQEKLPVPEGCSVEEALSPVGPLQCSRLVIHSRTSSHSSGFEEGSSSLTETSDASTWRDLSPRVADSGDCLTWTGESLGGLSAPGNNEARDVESNSSCLKTPKPQSSTTCDEDSVGYSPEMYLSAEEVYGEYFASRQNPRLLASCREPGEMRHASEDMPPVSDARSFSTTNPSDIRDSTEQTTFQNCIVKTLSSVRNRQKPINLEFETRQSMSGQITDHEALSEPSKFSPKQDKGNVDSSDGEDNRNLREGDKNINAPHLSLKCASNVISRYSTSKKIEEISTVADSDNREKCNQFNGETFRKGKALEVAQLRKCTVDEKVMDVCSPRTIDEESSDTGSPDQRNYSFCSSTSSTSDKDLPNSVVSGKDLTDPHSLMSEKVLVPIKNKSTVSRVPGSRSGSLQVSRSHSFQPPRRSSNPATNENAAPRFSEIDPGTRGALGRRKNIAFVVGDEDFGRFHTKPHGIEAKMVLPYTECEGLSGFGERKDSISAIRKFWLEKSVSPSKTPGFSGINRQKKPDESRFNEGQPSASKNHQSVTKSTTIIRRHSDRRDRLAPEVTGTFGSNRSVNEIATRYTGTEKPDIKPREHHLGGIPSSAHDYLETLSVGNLSAKTRVDDGTSLRYKQSSFPSTSTRVKTVDADMSESHSVSGYPGNTQEEDSPERLAETQPPDRIIQESRYQSDTSLQNVESDLSLAKKFEAFNVRLAAMASAAAAKHPPSSICSDTGKLFDSFKPGKSMSSESIISEEGSYDETKVASVYEGDCDSKWKTVKLPVLRATSGAFYQKINMGSCASRDIWRRQSDACDDILTMYRSSLENRNRFLSADIKSASLEEDNPTDSQLKAYKSAVSWKAEQGRRLSSSTTDLHLESRDDEFSPRTPEARRGSYNRLEISGRHITGSASGLLRSQSKIESCRFDSKPKKTLQEQGEELQHQFSRWHRQLVSEKSKSFFANRENNAGQPGSTFLSKSFDNCSSLDAIPKSERLQYMSGEVILSGTATKPVIRRSTSDRGVHHQETGLGSVTGLWKNSDEPIQKDRKERTSVDTLDRKSGTRSLTRSLSCVQPQTDAIPRTAMAKFNDDGTPRSILKKTRVMRSNSAGDVVYTKAAAAEEEDDNDDVYGLEKTENDRCHKSVDETADTVLPPLPTSPPPSLPSPAPSDLQTKPPSLIPSYTSSTRSSLLPFSPPSLPSSLLPSLPSQTRISPYLPPPRPSPNTPHPPCFSPPPMPPSPPQWVSSFFSRPRPYTPPTTLDQSPSPLPPPLPSTTPPPMPRRPVASDSLSATSNVSSSSPAWSPDSGSSKFLGLQNLKKRTEILKKRSRSDLGATSPILDAIHQQ